MILSRIQFKKHWNNIRPGLGDPNSPIWVWEEESNTKSKWFISTPPLHTWSETITPNSLTKQHYWDWCNTNCIGSVLCYSSDETTEWWGFTSKKDITLWILKWT